MVFSVKLQVLPSYDDQNFRLKVSEREERLVFKISSTNQGRKLWSSFFRFYTSTCMQIS